MVEGGIGVAAVATGLILAPATGARSPLIPAVFGARWGAIADVLPLCFFALQASGPVSVSTAGYLYAVGDTSTVLRAAAATSVIWLAVTLPLLSSLGLTAVGLGWMVSSLVEIPILSTPRPQTHRRARSSGRYSRRGSQRRSRVAPAGCSHATSVMASERQPWAQAQRLRCTPRRCSSRDAGDSLSIVRLLTRASDTQR